MNDQQLSDKCTSSAAKRRLLREFLRYDCDERLFVHPTCHPSRPTGFCYCDGSLFGAICFYIKAIFLIVVFKLPYNSLKVRALRMCGARVGQHVYFSAGVQIDPMFPQLITIEDDVFFGTDVKIFTHEFRIDEFRAGRVIIRRGSFIGGMAVIACGVEIGEGAVVSACAQVARDIPPGATVVARPPRIVKRDDGGMDESDATPRTEDLS